MKHLYVYICISLLQLNSYACKVLCIRDSYSGGYFKDKQCACYDLKGAPEQFARRSVNLGPSNAPEPIVAFRDDEKSGKLYVSPGWDSNDR